MFDVVYKPHAVVCVSVFFDIACKFKVSGPKYLFL